MMNIPDECPYCGYVKYYDFPLDPAFFMDQATTLTQQDASGWTATLCGCPKCKKVFIF